MGGFVQIHEMIGSGDEFVLDFVVMVVGVYEKLLCAKENQQREDEQYRADDDAAIAFFPRILNHSEALKDLKIR